MNSVEQTTRLRSTGIGGSDAGVIAGLDPFKSALELYYEKRNEIEQPDLTDNKAVKWGKLLEDVLADEYTRVTGRKLRRVNQTLRHPELSWMMAHLDRDVVGLPRIWEGKTTRYAAIENWGPAGSDQVPERYLLQAQHYMGVKPKVEVVDLWVLISGQEYRPYEIGRDQQLIDYLIEIEEAFWNNVQNGIPPAWDDKHVKSDLDLMKRLYPGTNGEIIHLDQAETWYLAWQEAKEHEKRYKSAKESAQAHLLELMGEAAVGLLPDGTSFTRKLVQKKGYEVKPSEYIDFRHSKKRWKA